MAAELFVWCCFDINRHNNAIRVNIALQIERTTQTLFGGLTNY